MIPESRKLTWRDEGFPLDSDEEADERVRRDLHHSWKVRKNRKAAESEVYTRFKKEGLTDIQAYVATYRK